MNIIPSVYKMSELENFKQKEIERIGEKNIKTVRFIEKVISIFSILPVLPLLGIMVLFQNNIIGFFLSIIYMFIWFKGSTYLTDIDCSRFKVYKLTLKIIKKKGISFSPIETKFFEGIYKEYKNLCDIQNFIKEHPDAAFEYNYVRNGWVYLIYNDGNYIKREAFELDNDLGDYLFKEDKIDFSCCDEEIKKILEKNK